MALTRQTATAIVLLGVGVAFGVVRPELHANLENASLLHSLSGIYQPDFAISPQSTWDHGWKRLCVDDAQPTLPEPKTASALRNTVAAAFDLGDFPAAERIAVRADDWGRIRALLRGDWTQAADKGWDTPAEVPPLFWGTVLYLGAQQSATRGDVESAIQQLQRSGDLIGDSGPLSSPALAQCLARQGRAPEAAQEWRRAAASLPTDQAVETLATKLSIPIADARTEWVPAAEADPSHKIQPVTDGDWTLVGFDVDAVEVRMSPLLDVTTYWTTAQRPADVAVRHMTTRDLVANGGFQWDFVAPGVVPFGFPSSVYHNRVPVSVVASEGHGSALCLTRPTREEGVGLEGLRFGLSRRSGLVVQGGDVASPNGSGYALARRWFGAENVPYNFLASGPAAPDDWVSFAGAVQQPVGADAVGVWILNASGAPGGETCYADLYMFEAFPPDIASSTGSNTRS